MIPLHCGKPMENIGYVYFTAKNVFGNPKRKKKIRWRCQNPECGQIIEK